MRGYLFAIAGLLAVPGIIMLSIHHWKSVRYRNFMSEAYSQFQGGGLDALARRYRQPGVVLVPSRRGLVLGRILFLSGITIFAAAWLL